MDGANHRYTDAVETAEKLRDTFGADSFFIELQDDLTPDSSRVNRELSLLARLGLGVVATNNVHYATREDSWRARSCAVWQRRRLERRFTTDKPLNSSAT